jgi:hypothetical protein
MRREWERAMSKRLDDEDLEAAKAICHCIVHGNVTALRQFLDGIGDDTRRAAMRAFILANAPVKWDRPSEGDEKTFVYDVGRRDALKKAYNKDRLAFAGRLRREAKATRSGPRTK